MKNSYAKLLVLITASVFLGACGPSIDMTKTGKGFFAKTDADHVEILSTLPDKGFEEVATFSTSGWDASDTAKMHNGIRLKAADIGGDAAVIQNSGINLVQSGFSTKRYLWSTGVVLHFKDE